MVEAPGGLGLRVPRYAAEAIEASPRVIARIGGSNYPGAVGVDADHAWLLLDPGLGQLGVGVGDEVDVFLRADL